jgi:hypothetical protein
MRGRCREVTSRQRLDAASSQETARLADGRAAGTDLCLGGEQAAAPALTGAAAAHADERETGGPEEYSELHRFYSGKAIR